MKFGQKAKNIKTKVKANEVEKESEDILAEKVKLLQKEVERLNKQNQTKESMIKG